MAGPTHHHGFDIKIDNRQFHTPDPLTLGRQLLTLAGKAPIDQYLIFQMTPDSVMVDIGLDKPVDLREPGRETFVTFKSDRSFRFELDGKRQDWGAPEITEPTLRELACAPASHRVWLERQNEADLLLERGQSIRLDNPGIERFRTGVLEHDDKVTITINEHPHRVRPGNYTVAALKTLDSVPLTDDLEQIINGQLTLLPDDGRVAICGGEIFASHPKSGSSS